MLKDILQKTLSDVFAFYLKAQFYHWNVEGDDFYQYHKLFGKIYEDVHGSVDIIAEQIRTLDSYAYGSLSKFKQTTTIEEDDEIPSNIQMAERLFQENKKVLASLMTSYLEAEKVGELGVSNYLQDRIQAHQKHSWFLRSAIK